MRIGGWWRLWIVLSGIYTSLVMIIAFSVASWPTVESISHHPSFNYRMSEQAQAVINKRWDAKQLKADVESMLADNIPKEEIDEYVGSHFPITLQMANGHTYEVARDDKSQDFNVVAQEYTHVLRSEMQTRRKDVIVTVFGIWIVPIAVACLLGLMTRWVWSGFVSAKRDSKTAHQ